MTVSDNFVCVASILSPHGIKGYFKVKYFTENSEDILSYGKIFNEQKIIFDISIVSFSKNFLICKSNLISNRSDAEKLNGEKLYILRENLPILEKNEYYNYDLIGLKVFKKNRDYVGSVSSVLNYGAGDILEVNIEKKKSLLLPFGPSHNSKVNLEEQEIEINVSEDWFK